MKSQIRNPLGWAAKFGQTAMVEFLLQRGANLNLPDDPAWATRWPGRTGAGMQKSPGC